MKKPILTMSAMFVAFMTQAGVSVTYNGSPVEDGTVIELGRDAFQPYDDMPGYKIAEKFEIKGETPMSISVTSDSQTFTYCTQQCYMLMGPNSEGKYAHNSTIDITPCPLDIDASFFDIEAIPAIDTSICFLLASSNDSFSFTVHLNTTNNEIGDIPVPVIKATRSSSAYVRQISDNGKWGVITLDGDQDGNILPGGSVLVNLETMKETKLTGGKWSGVNDVTDDGNIVVGTIDGLPGYYNVSKAEWVKLKLPTSYVTGYLSAVSADGKYAVGSASPADNIYYQIPIAYDLTTGDEINLTGLPKLDMTHENQNQMTFDRISGDGKYVLGVMSFSYIMPPSLCTFVYNLENHTYKMVGFTENAYKAWTSKAPNMLFVDACNMSPNGRWVTGQAYMSKPVAGSEFGNEYIASFLYDVENDKFEVYDGQYDADVSGISVTNDGVVLGTTPAVNPYSETMIRRDGYWYSLRTIFEKVYGVDIEAKAHVSVTGKPVAVSGDGLTTAQLCSQRDTYILKMGESFLDASKRIRILGTPDITPANNSDIAQISSVKLRFDRKVEVSQSNNKILLKRDGQQYATALNTYIDGNELTIVFRTRTLDKGVTYTVEIPEKFVTLLGDKNEGNAPITITYKGRGTGAVEIVSAQPADGSTFSYIDATANPLMFTFDTQVAIADGANFYLYEEDLNEPISNLELLASGNIVIAYPVLSQRLYKDVNYTVKIPAGSVTDVTGIGPNEEYIFHYTGNYVREVQATEKYLFVDDCDNRYNYMTFEGDHNKPIDDLVYWNFTSEIPWVEVRESNETTDMALASHSMYSPAGKSDDWLVIPQIFIPDELCYLQFQSQGYKADTEDHLKVYVYHREDVLNRLTADIVADIRVNGVLVYDKVQDPGASQEGLSGDWTDNNVSLADFAGKSVYIAFVNDNEDQSAVFLDNVRVLHDVTYTIAFSNQESVVNADEMTIKGVITIASEVEHYSSIEMTLVDSEGDVVSKISKTGLDLKEGDKFDFEFAKPLLLDKGVVNNFAIKVKLGNDETTIASSVKNLLFKADKNVVIEEFTGTTCPNCPRGILAIENLERYYKGRIIPIGIHSYTGDRLNSGMDAYAGYLGLNAAPSGRVNRGPVSEPMAVVANDYKFSGMGVIDETGEAVKTWFDHATEQINTAADADIEFSAQYDKSTGKITVPGKVTFSLGYPNRNVNLFTVILENDIEEFQQNNHYSLTSEALGEWGKGGIYGTANVYPYTQHHVARGVLSTLYSGTPGLIPAKIEAGKSYEFKIESTMPATVSEPNNTAIVVMALDSDTFEFINAGMAKINDPEGSKGAVGEMAIGDVELFVENGVLYAVAEGEVYVTVHTLEGIQLADVSGTMGVSVDLRNYTGIVIVNAKTESGIKSVKIAL